jgi:aspartyl protease family protein
MDSWDFGNLIYLLLLGGVLVGWFVVQNRGNLRRSVQHASVWVLIFFGVIAVIGLWDDISQTIRPTQSVFADSGRIEVPRAPDGHYYLTLGINEVPVRFVVDTGASNMVLTLDAARRVGLNTDDLAYVGRAATANGDVRTAPVTLDSVALGPIVDRNVRAFVNEGEMFESLLGMSYLRRWSRIEIAEGKLVLIR